MRIAYVYDAVYPFVKGGGERRIYEVAQRLARRGHEVFVLGMKYWSGPASLQSNGLYYRALGRRLDLYHRSGRRSISEAVGFGLSAWRLLSHDRYDVIDCGQWPYFHFFPAKTYSFFRKTPVVVTWYEVWRQHWLEYLGSLGIAGMLAERTFCRFPDRIVAVSEMTRAALFHLGANQERVTVIPNGIDYHRIELAPAGPVATDVAYCGRLKNHKNVHLLIEAVALLKRSRPAISAVIIGDGPEALNLRNLTSRLGLNENITFTGSLENFDDVIAWLKASKVFVNPSSKEGGGSITLFEANACGLPVIAIKCADGIDPRLIQQAENGYFVEPVAEQIAETTLTLLNNSDRLTANSVVSKQMAAGYDWDVVASQYERVYEREILMRRNSS